MLTFRSHPVRSGDFFVVHEGEACMSHVQFSCQIFLDLEGEERERERERERKVTNLLFFFNSLQTRGEG